MVACLVALLSALSSTPALAEPSPETGQCSEYAVWAARCTQPGFRFEVMACPDRVLIGSARLDGQPALDIEISEHNPRAFRQVGSIGVQPIGEFKDWAQEPAFRQATLKHLLACIERVGPPVFTTQTSKPAAKPLGSSRLLWLGLLLVGSALGLAHYIRRSAASGSAPGAGQGAGEDGGNHARLTFPTEILALTALSVATGLVRWRLVPPAPFHQNGQAPLWIAEAARAPLSPSVYGPGFQEVFGWFASHGQPDFRVYIAQGVLLALAPAAAHLIFRLAGAGRIAAWIVSIAVAINPLLARLAGGESYMATIGGLGFLAAAGLALAAQPGHALRGQRLRIYLFLCGVGGAACLIAQAARVHPVGWLGLATLGLVVPCMGGQPKAFVQRGLIALSIIGALVCVTSLPAMLEVLHGELGQKWMPATRLRPSALRVLLFLPLWLLTRRRAQDWLPVATLALTVELAFAANSLGAASTMIHEAYFTLYLPAALAGAAGYAASVRWRAGKPAAAIALVAPATALAYAHVSAYLTLPTDAREVQLLTRWVREVPESGSVLYLGRAGQRVLLMPSYDPSITIYLAESGQRPPPFERGRDLHYYRSSLCSTQDGRAACQELESRLDLAPIAEVTLPAIASLPYLPLDPGELTVGWYRVTSSRR